MDTFFTMAPESVFVSQAAVVKIIGAFSIVSSPIKYLQPADHNSCFRGPQKTLSLSVENVHLTTLRPLETCRIDTILYKEMVKMTPPRIEGR